MKHKVVIENVDGSVSEEHLIDLNPGDTLVASYTGGMKEKAIAKEILEDIMKDRDNMAIMLPSFITLKIIRVKEVK